MAGEKRDALSSGAYKRAVYAYTLRYFSNSASFTGEKVFDYNQEPEVAIAGRLFDSLGLDSSRVILEAASRNTWLALHEYIGLLYYVIAYR